MWNMFLIGIVAVLAGACVTWLVGDALPESVAARSEDEGRFAGLGSASRETPRRVARMGAVAAQRQRIGAFRRRRVAHHAVRSAVANSVKTF